LPGARAEIGNRRPGRHGERIGAEKPDQVGQGQDEDHEQRIERVERHQRAPPPRRRDGKSCEEQQQSDRIGSGQQQQAGFDRPGKPCATPVLAGQLPGMQQQQRPERARQHQGSEFDAGRTEGDDRDREQYREHRLLPANNRARQLIKRQEGDDGADLRQQIDAKHLIAGGAERDVGEPKGERRPEIGSNR
jgi:hypothetical protein